MPVARFVLRSGRGEDDAGVQFGGLRAVRLSSQPRPFGQGRVRTLRRHRRHGAFRAAVLPASGRRQADQEHHALRRLPYAEPHPRQPQFRHRRAIDNRHRQAGRGRG